MKFVSIIVLVMVIAMGAVSTANAGDLGLLTQTEEDEIIVGVKYTSSHFGEFLWGLSRPFHMYNTQPDGTRVTLPFYSRPMTDGGFLSWLNSDSWDTNANLTAGALASEITLAVLIGSAM